MATGRKARSAKGMVVDFDLLAIKQQIATDPPPIAVANRQNLIDARLRRRTRTASVAKVAPVEVTPTLPSPNDDEPVMIDETKETPVDLVADTADAETKAKTTTTTTKQKARTKD